VPLGEFELIARFFADGFTDRDDIVLGVGDDAAVVRVPAGSELVAAADTIVCGVHFPVATAAEHIGHRALAVNLSDVAAMGAAPCWCTLALTLPAVDEHWLQDFTRGFRELAVRHGVALIGGDTTRGPLTLTVQLLGLVPSGTAIRRSGARAGELVFVSGTVGDAAAGLALIQKEVRGAPAAHEAYLRQRFLAPTPRVELGLALRGIASAAIDISDGLHADVNKLLAASAVGAQLDLDQLPLSRGLLERQGIERARQLALSGGDDYELCFTVPVERAGEAERAAVAAGCPIHRVGVIEASAGVRYLENGRPVSVDAPGYDHFR
jgi:thiamine-monophosphate kinase